ncbi:hypothetical protein [Dactylosporangium sp. NPDC051541]|uniref:hypothetical protein n=1 Tax=Dactylosporangium sp. NPDC051541 TaxID=3363977 RepID=UPI0037B8DD8F
MNPDWSAAWDAALAAMELEADAVEQMLRHRDRLEQAPERAVFTPPTGIGPLPMELTDRARLLMQRQLDLSRELSIAIASNRQQSRLVNRTRREGSGGGPPPVYHDIRT